MKKKKVKFICTDPEVICGDAIGDNGCLRKGKCVRKKEKEDDDKTNS